MESENTLAAQAIQRSPIVGALAAGGKPPRDIVNEQARANLADTLEDIQLKRARRTDIETYNKRMNGELIEVDAVENALRELTETLVQGVYAVMSEVLADVSPKERNQKETSIRRGLGALATTLMTEFRSAMNMSHPDDDPSPAFKAAATATKRTRTPATKKPTKKPTKRGAAGGGKVKGKTKNATSPRSDTSQQTRRKRELKRVTKSKGRRR